MTFYATALWLYAAMASVVFGASIYETFVVHPAWSRKPPESFVGFMEPPISRMNIPGFWKPVAPLYALCGLVAWIVARWVGSATVALTVSAACAIFVVAWTLIYFRRNIERFLEAQGGNTPADRLQSEARQWILLNWIRLALVVVSWCGALKATVAHG
jgi:hypothetical protein